MSKLILVVEDEAFLSDTIQQALEEHGVRVKLAEDGQAAVDAIENEKPDLVLLDLLMPRKDGFFVLRHIREKHYQFPVVILSNLSGDLTPEKCFAIGAKDYLVKSDMDEDELWPRIKKYL
jgi:two-component system, OmpR family, response regulator VicR